MLLLTTTQKVMRDRNTREWTPVVQQRSQVKLDVILSSALPIYPFHRNGGKVTTCGKPQRRYSDFQFHWPP